MAYNITPVDGAYSLLYVPSTGFPTTFRYFLASVWFEFKPDHSGFQMLATGFKIGFSGDARTGVEIHLTFPTDSSPRVLNVRIGDGNPYNSPVPGNPYMGLVGFDMDSLVAGEYYNLLVSIDSVANIVQCYVNDAALPSGSDPDFWGANNPIAEPVSGASGDADGLIFVGAENNGVGTNPCMADAWWGTTAAFCDLSIEANRRKFINADLSPVYLGTNGQIPFSGAPQVYASIPTGGFATDFLPNRGTTGGSFTNSGVGLLCDAPPPVNKPVLACGPHGLTFITPTWTYDDDVDTYTLQYRKVGDTDWIEVSGIVGNAYEIDGLPLGTCYELQVQAVFESVPSDFSDVVTCCTLTQIAMADLWFGSTAAFVDLTVTGNRRKFISAEGGAENLGGSGSRPFGSAPTVFLTNGGVPNTFATNNGTGGSFAISSDKLYDGPSNPPGTSTTTTTTQDNTLNHGVLGDYRNGRLYAFNKATLTDNGTPRKWLRRWRALPQATDHAVKFNWLNIGVQTGIGVPPGTNPQLMLRWSDDGGNTWSHGRFLAVGKTGATTQIIKFNRLGMTRRFGGSDRIFELSSTDPFEVALLDAEVEAV